MELKWALFALLALLTASSSSCFPREFTNCAYSTRHGVLWLSPLDEMSESFTVVCDQRTAGGDWTLVLDRFDGSVRFHDRSWDEFRNGFGDFDGEFFLGLDKLHALTTSRRHELLFVMVDFENVTRTASYAHFQILDGGDLYFIAELKNYVGDAGDYFAKDYFCTNERYCTIQRGKVPGWNRYRRLRNYVFAEHAYNVDKRDSAMPVMCWWRAGDGECVRLRALKMLIRPVNPFLATHSVTTRPKIKNFHIGKMEKLECHFKNNTLIKKKPNFYPDIRVGSLTMALQT